MIKINRNKKYIIGDNLSIADIAIAAQLSLLKFPKSSGPILSGEGCQGRGLEVFWPVPAAQAIVSAMRIMWDYH